MVYRKGRTQTYSPQIRKPRLSRVYQKGKIKGVWYYPKCVNPELTERLRVEGKL